MGKVYSLGAIIKDGEWGGRYLGTPPGRAEAGPLGGGMPQKKGAGVGTLKLHPGTWRTGGGGLEGGRRGDLGSHNYKKHF